MTIGRTPGYGGTPNFVATSRPAYIASADVADYSSRYVTRLRFTVSIGLDFRLGRVVLASHAHPSATLAAGLELQIQPGNAAAKAQQEGGSAMR